MTASPRSLRRTGGCALALGFLLLAGLPAAGASAATITFEDLAATAPGPGGSGLPVNNQYESSHGVSFTNASAFNYSKGPSAIPNFAHSGTVAVEACVAIEFCQAPLAATFTAAQTRVAVWVGFENPLTQPVGVRLTAFNATTGGTVVGTANATLPARSTPTPIQTQLAVQLASPQIRRIEVSVTTAGGYTNGLDVDDVEFSTAGPPPPCNATAAPVVTLLQPEGSPITPDENPVVQSDAFTLEGTVTLDPNGAPITSATVTATAQGSPPRVGTGFPTPIDADGGHFGPISYGGILSPGDNDIVVRASNCFGVGTSFPGRVTYDPLQPGTRFRQLGLVEVTQTVQNPSNGVPLIAASANSIKRTFARVYLTAENGSPIVRNVSGRLTAIRPDGSLPGGPVTIPSLNRIDVSAGMTRENARRSSTRSLNFELPPEWQAAGRLHLRLSSTFPSLPCEQCENVVGGLPGQGIRPATVTFHRAPPLRIMLVMVPWKPSPSEPTVIPQQGEIDLIRLHLQRMFPSSDPQIIEEGFETRIGRPLCTEVNADLSIVARRSDAHPGTNFYGVIADGGNPDSPDGKGGCAAGGKRFGSGLSGTSSGAPYGHEIAAHELGHTFGRAHAPSPGDNCAEKKPERVDSSFPYSTGLIGNAQFDNLGIAESPTGFEILDWRSSVADVMSYCDPAWISDYTYRGILRRLCLRNLGDCPTLPVGRRDPRQRAAPSRAGGRSPAKRRLLVSGTLKLRSGRLALSELAVMPGLRATTRPRKSRYSIELRGRRGRTLARYRFRPGRSSDQPNPRRPLAQVSEVVPFKAATRRIVIRKGKRTLASRRVSAHAPRVRVLAPRRGAGGRVTVRWRSGDADGDRRTYTVLYSDDGKRYFPLASGLRKRSFRAALGDRPGGPRARFQVIASDGVLTASDTSPRVRVEVKPPRILIATPARDAQVSAGDPLTLVVSVADLQDVPFAAGRVVWRSSLQGELGRGTAISASLAAGTHEITATATNSGGKSAVARLTVTATTPPPFFDGTP